jgi:hypothetical protein
VGDDAVQPLGHLNDNPVQVHGDATPFLMNVAGSYALVVAGQLDTHVAAVQVNERPCLIGKHGWISEPFPTDPGMELRIVWLGHDGRPVRTIKTVPLDPHRLGPLFAPDEWTSYGPPVPEPEQ